MNEPRNVAIYLARTWSGLPLDEIGKGFGLEKYSSVSSIVGRAEKQLALNKELRKTVAAVRRSIEKSQAKT
jgi:chromosomal replication initiation ATPase DnaA